MTASRKKREKHWFWVWLVQMTVAKKDLKNSKALGEVWENLKLIRAIHERQAYNKAMKIGRSEAGDCDGSLTLWGRPAMAKFLGVSDMGLIDDELEDGVEILWRLKRYRQFTARKLIPRKEKLLTDARKELSHLPTK